jgi:hypothetical protein
MSEHFSRPDMSPEEVLQKFRALNRDGHEDEALEALAHPSVPVATVLQDLQPVWVGLERYLTRNPILATWLMMNDEDSRAAQDLLMRGLVSGNMKALKARFDGRRDRRKLAEAFVKELDIGEARSWVIHFFTNSFANPDVDLHTIIHGSERGNGIERAAWMLGLFRKHLGAEAYNPYGGLF